MRRGKDPCFSTEGIDLDRHPECQDLPLVRRVAADLTRLWGHLPGLEFEDLLQAGYLVLCHCRECYDPAKGPWAPYLSQSLRRHMSRMISDGATPLTCHGGTRDWARKSLAEDEQGLTARRLRTRQKANQSTRMVSHSLEALAARLPLWPFGRWAAREDLFRQLDRLPQLQRWVLTKHYGLDGEPPLKYEEIGRIWPGGRPVTRQRAEQVHNVALRTLREALQ